MTPSFRSLQAELFNRPRLVTDHGLSPLDLAIASIGNIVVSSERPFGAAGAVTSVREYDATHGHLVRVFSPTGSVELRKPRGLRFGSNGHLYCVAQDEVVAFDFATGECLGAVANASPTRTMTTTKRPPRNTSTTATITR